MSAITSSNGTTFLAVSNYRNEAGAYDIPSYVMRYNTSTKLFEHFQNITAYGAYPPEFYQIGSDTFLTIPNYYNGANEAINSVIYKLDASSGYFSLFQNIPTNGGTHLKPWTRNSQQYLSVVNWHGGYIDIFVLNPTQGQYVNVTSGSRLFSSGPHGADVIDIAGDTYMAVAPEGVDVRIFKWSDAISRFEQTQRVSVTPGFFYPHFFTVGADTFLALADMIFKFCGNIFVLA
jgi:hypothetical protein